MTMTGADEGAHSVHSPLLDARSRNLRRRLSQVERSGLVGLVQAQAALVSLEVAAGWEPVHREQVTELIEHARAYIVEKSRSAEAYRETLRVLGAQGATQDGWTVVAFQDCWPDPALHVVCLTLGLTEGPAYFAPGCPRVLLVPPAGVAGLLARIHAAGLPGEQPPVFVHPVEQRATAEVLACLWDPLDTYSAYRDLQTALGAARLLAGERSLVSRYLREWSALHGAWHP